MTGASAVTVELSGLSTTATATTDGSGNYTFPGLPDGTYTVAASKLGHAVSPARRDVVVSSANQTGRDFTAVALASYDPLAADTLDGGRWQTPEYVRTISGGKAQLSVRANGMQSNLTHGLTYTSGLTVAATGGGRVTSFQADVTVPAAGATRSGSATIYGGLRLYYQPAANRGLAFPGANLNQLIAAIELYDSGTGPRVRRRFAHCDDAACVTLGGSGISASDPGGFTPSGVNATAAAAYDTTYTLALSVNEATGVFTWTIQGGSFGAGVSGTADVATWAGTVGMTLASATNGFLSAQLLARASDASPGGGGSGALTAIFDDVRVGIDGASATLYDDFSTLGSSDATGFSPTKWGAWANAAAQPSGGSLHLHSGATTAYPTDQQGTTLAARYPSTFNAWQADVAIVAENPGSQGTAYVGGAFLSDGSGGGTNDGTGDIVSNVFVRSGGASIWIGRCTNAPCTDTLTTVAYQALTPAAGHPLGVGTVHTVFQQWDPTTRTFVYRLDDGAPVRITLSSPTVAAPHVPSRFVRAVAAVPWDAAPGTTAAVDVAVSNVRVAP